MSNGEDTDDDDENKERATSGNCATISPQRHMEAALVRTVDIPRLRRKAFIEEKLFPETISLNHLHLEETCCCCLLEFNNSNSGSDHASCFDKEPSSEIVEVLNTRRKRQREEVSWIGLVNCCFHVFHYNCIVSWANRENRCPQCKLRFHLIAVYSRNGCRLDYKSVRDNNQSVSDLIETDSQDGATSSGLIPCFVCQRIQRFVPPQQPSLVPSADNDTVCCEGDHGSCMQICHLSCLGILLNTNRSRNWEFCCPTCIRRHRCANADGARLLDSRAAIRHFNLPSLSTAPTQMLVSSPSLLDPFLELYRSFYTLNSDTSHGRRLRRQPQTTGRRRGSAISNSSTARRTGRSTVTTLRYTREPRISLSNLSNRRRRRRRTSSALVDELPEAENQLSGSHVIVLQGDNAINDLRNNTISFENVGLRNTSEGTDTVLRASHLVLNTQPRQNTEEQSHALAQDDEYFQNELSIDEAYEAEPGPLRGVPSDFREYERYEREVLGHTSYGKNRFASRLDDGGCASGSEFVAGLLGNPSAEDIISERRFLQRRCSQASSSIFASQQSSLPTVQIRMKPHTLLDNTNLGADQSSSSSSQNATPASAVQTREPSDVKVKNQLNSISCSASSSSLDSHSFSDSLDRISFNNNTVDETKLSDYQKHNEQTKDKFSQHETRETCNSNTNLVPDEDQAERKKTIEAQDCRTSIDNNSSPFLFHESSDLLSESSCIMHRIEKRQRIHVKPTKKLVEKIRNYLYQFNLAREDFKSVCRGIAEALVEKWHSQLVTRHYTLWDSFWEGKDSVIYSEAELYMKNRFFANINEGSGNAPTGDSIIGLGEETPQPARRKRYIVQDTMCPLRLSPVNLNFSTSLSFCC